MENAWRMENENAVEDYGGCGVIISGDEMYRDFRKTVRMLLFYANTYN